jgi:hypothetical protein
MAHYEVFYKGKMYVNRALLKAACHMGDPGIIKMLNAGELTTCKILGEVVYEASRWDKDIFDALKPQIQNIEDQLGALDTASMEHTADMKWYSASGNPKYDFEGFEFVNLSEMHDDRRYRLCRRMAQVRVCGGVYIALGTININEPNPVVTREY